MNNHYNCIYMYINKINYKKYIGQTKDFNKRHKEHISDSYNKKRKYEYNFPFHNAIRHYGIDNFEIMILAENIKTQEQMDEYEKFFIKRYDTLAKNRKGYNVDSGGKGGNKYAGKTKEEMDEFKRKQSEINKGRKFSDEWKINISNSRKGIKLSEEHKQIISKNTKGKNNPKAKRVAQYDLDGNLIKVWDYIKDISNSIDGINYSGLKSVLQGVTKTNIYKGFTWKYLSDCTEEEILNYIITKLQVPIK